MVHQHREPTPLATTEQSLAAACPRGAAGISRAFPQQGVGGGRSMVLDTGTLQPTKVDPQLPGTSWDFLGLPGTSWEELNCIKNR